MPTKTRNPRIRIVNHGRETKLEALSMVSEVEGQAF